MKADLDPQQEFCGTTVANRAWKRGRLVVTLGPLAVVIVFLAIVLVGGRPRTVTLTPAALAGEGEAFSYDRYAAVLSGFVDASGMVYYEGLKKRQRDLSAFAAQLAGLDRSVYDVWTDQEKIAFWINAYNALTLVAIVDNYPIKASAARSLAFPENSIRQIPGVWKKLQFLVMGEPIALDTIEHKQLRGTFDEPRIHVALVCAAMSCPTLRDEPFTAERLDAQLTDQGKKFFAEETKFRIDREGGAVHLSSIFKWFAEDFVQSYGTKEKFAGRSDQERAVLHFASAHAAERDRAYLETGKYSIKHLEYDWTLNERLTPVTSSP